MIHECDHGQYFQYQREIVAVSSHVKGKQWEIMYHGTDTVLGPSVTSAQRTIDSTS